jgi:starvation-inducible DNA-binding protein
MEAKFGIKQELLTKGAFELSKILADEFLLYTKTRNAHWNVEGSGFQASHEFFEDQYGSLDEAMDDVAERIRSLGHYAPATLKEFLKLTKLTEQSREANTGAGFMKELLADHEAIIIRLRESINLFARDYQDAGTSDFVTGLMVKHEKMAWTLRAHLK